MVLSLDRFVGKVAIVTGASAGIGVAIVEQLVKNGVIVAGLARRVELIEELAKKLSGEKGKLHAFKCDISKEGDIVSVFKEIVRKLGNISILVNNAGLARQTDLINGDTEKWKLTLDTNVLGLSIATREAIQNMKENGTQGHIIHINSVLGHKVVQYPDFHLNIYGATKYAVTALTETLRLDISREKLPIKITSVSPGYVRTEFLSAASYPDEATPPLFSPDVADAVIFALSTPPHVNINEVILQAVGS